ncbi:zf-HC2 domain-containing protein [Phytohabitans sp. ZYX-F-186]|uniref:Zf-HC2 domain-containing protein n=1 Tax=Phytohabitans maris TaxID=3071409 RepID=A0ABU0ZMY5_9ACTN|nr:zf-HC2 domain-containing protein [Phytohabitans sp. ZYX-F-186]MDQ7908318.1 zf-HC2 domain-containing protein [Phytohabitans sp. ZYX-F-186]
MSTGKPAPGHVPARLLEQYAAGSPDGALVDVWWAVEAHLESCGSCRDRLAAAVARCAPATASLVERAWAGLAEQVTGGPEAAARRGWRPGRTVRWAAPPVLPRLAATVLVVLAAVGLDLVNQAGTGRFPSLVLLLAPVAPLLAVAAAWSRGLDPAHEVVVASPRAGLDLVLRRAVAVLAVVIPVLAVAGWLVGASPAGWLLPCLALTAGALALGGLVGLHRAATGLGLAWIAVVAGPSLVVGRTPVLLDPAAVAVWAPATVAVTVLVVVRRGAYTAFPSGR